MTLNEEINYLTQEEIPFHVPQKVVEQLNKGKKKVLKYDQDRVYVITGREGLGKSKLSRQLAYVCDPTINLDRVVFSSEQFKKAVEKGKKGQAIIWDECFRGMSSKSTISKENKDIVSLLMECRFKNLFIFLVLPSFFLLDKYPALERSHALFNVIVSKKNFLNRCYKIYPYNKKIELYVKGKVTLSYSLPRIAKKYRFYNKEIPNIDYDEYVDKKRLFFRQDRTKEEDKAKIKSQRDYLIYYICEKNNISQKKLADDFKEQKLGLGRTSINQIISNTAKRLNSVEIQ